MHSQIMRESKQKFRVFIRLLIKNTTWSRIVSQRDDAPKLVVKYRLPKGTMRSNQLKYFS
jgi:hypothetical protein